MRELSFYIAIILWQHITDHGLSLQLYIKLNRPSRLSSIRIIVINPESIFLQM